VYTQPEVPLFRSREACIVSHNLCNIAGGWLHVHTVLRFMPLPQYIMTSGWPLLAQFFLTLTVSLSLSLCLSVSLSYTHTHARACCYSFSRQGRNLPKGSRAKQKNPYCWPLLRLHPHAQKCGRPRIERKRKALQAASCSLHQSSLPEEKEMHWPEVLPPPMEKIPSRDLEGGWQAPAPARDARAMRAIRFKCVSCCSRLMRIVHGALLSM